MRSVIAMSTIEAEYLVATNAAKEVVSLKMVLEKFGYKKENITLLYDNQSALHLAGNPVFHSKTRHIRVQYHFICDKVERAVDM